MACLYRDHATDANVTQDSQDSWVSRWLKRYAQASFTKFEQLSFHGGQQAKIDFSSDAKDKDKLEMMFDEAQDLATVDKLSQVIVLLVPVETSNKGFHCLGIRGLKCCQLLFQKINGTQCMQKR